MSLAGYSVMNSVGREVKINRGGPDSIVGVLVSSQSSYLAVLTKEGIVYVNSAHVKSISDTGKSGGANALAANPIVADSFAGLLQALRHQFVQINRGGPEKVEGIVIEANQTSLILASKGKEVISIPVFHIKSITVTSNSSNSSGGNNNNKSGGNNNKSGGNNNQSKGNQSKGNQSNSNQSKGNQSKGNQTRGNQTRGNQTRGNQTRGNQSKGTWTWGNKTKGNQKKRNQSGNKNAKRGRNGGK